MAENFERLSICTIREASIMGREASSERIFMTFLRANLKKATCIAPVTSLHQQFDIFNTSLSYSIAKRTQNTTSFSQTIWVAN